MYHGEVNVAQDDLNAFLSIAEDLKVKGLTQNEKVTSPVDNKVIEDPPDRKRSKRPLEAGQLVKRPREENDINSEIVQIKSEPAAAPIDASSHSLAETNFRHESTSREVINTSNVFLEDSEDYSSYSDYQYTDYREGAQLTSEDASVTKG